MSGANSCQELISAPMSSLLPFFLATAAIIIRMSAIVLTIVPSLFFPGLGWFEMSSAIAITILTIASVLFIPDYPNILMLVTT